MEYTQILYDKSERIATITLNRPEQLNAFTTRMGNEIADALSKADADDDVRVVIVTGAGRGFCAGADLSPEGLGEITEITADKSGTGAGGTTAPMADPLSIIPLTVYNFKKPVIAAINGAAVGAGITMTLGMDIRLIAENAKIGFVFVRRGLVPEAASSWFLPRIVGISKAIDWVLTGKMITAQEALENRLATEVLPPESVLPRAREIALDIAQNTSAVSVALSRQMLWKMLGADHPRKAIAIDSKAIAWAFRQADTEEGVKSFLEKRPPNFTMKPSSDMPDFYPWWTEEPLE